MKQVCSCMKITYSEKQYGFFIFLEIVLNLVVRIKNVCDLYLFWYVHTNDPISKEKIELLFLLK